MAHPETTRTMRELRTDEADPRTRGELAGEALRGPIEQVEASYLRLFHALRGWTDDDVVRFGEQVLRVVAGWRPRLVAELEGVAAGAGRRLELVAALNARTEVVRLSECSLLARADAPDGPWLAQNWDWTVDAPDHTVVWNAAGDDGERFLTMTEAGLLAKVGVNTRGLALGLNILRHRDDALPPRIPVHLVLREILSTCATVDDVAGVLADVEFSASSAMTAVDSAGRVASFEVSPAGVSRVDADEQGFLARTNHFLDARLAEGEANPNVVGSRGRLAFLRAARPETVTESREVLSDHTCRPQMVCRHDEPDLPGFPDVGTAASLVLRPAEGAMDVAAGNPCSTPFVPYAVA